MRLHRITYTAPTCIPFVHTVDMIPINVNVIKFLLSYVCAVLFPLNNHSEVICCNIICTDTQRQRYHCLDIGVNIYRRMLQTADMERVFFCLFHRLFILICDDCMFAMAVCHRTPHTHNLAIFHFFE